MTEGIRGTWQDRHLPIWLRMARYPPELLKLPRDHTKAELAVSGGHLLPARAVTGKNGLQLIIALTVVRSCHTCPALLQTLACLNDDEVVCETCWAHRERAERRGSPRVDLEHFERRLSVTGLRKQARVLDTLGLTAEDPGAELEASEDRYRIACATARRYERAARRGLLIIAGDTGSGKSTAAAWVAWQTHGLFLPRAEWTKVQVRAADTSRLSWLLEHGGVLVLDDACVVRPGGVAGDSDWESEVVFQVAQARHEAGRGTVITTQAHRDELESAYGTRGEALCRRADAGLDLAGAPDGGGFVECSYA